MTTGGSATRGPLVVDVRRLRHRPGNRQPLVTSASLAGLATPTARVVDDRVELDLVLESLPEGVVATGTLAFTWTGQCSRCLRDAGGDARTDLRELFEDEPEEGETYPLGDDELDLEPAVREAVVLELPLQPLCQPGCKGLCANCGAELNEGDCGCEEPAGDPRWAALDELTFGDGGEADDDADET